MGIICHDLSLNPLQASDQIDLQAVSCAERQVFETRICAYVRQFNSFTGRAVSLLSDYDLRNPRFFAGILGVNFITINESDYVCILLYGAAFTKIAQKGPLSVRSSTFRFN